MIGIVILNYNTAEDTVECVESIISTCKLEYHIYIVDNQSTDDSYEKIKQRYNQTDGITILQSDINGGYSYGNNIGIKKALEDECDYLLISNPDIVFSDGAIELLYDDITLNQQIGVIGPSTPSLDQPESQLLRKVYTPGLYLCSKKPFLYLSRVFHNLKTEYDYPVEGYQYPFLFKGMVRGCCFLISSKLFVDIGLFDDNVFLYSEEWIIARKIAERGYLCAFEGNVKALHKEATSTRKKGTAFQSYHLYLSAFYYLQEYCKCGKIILLFFYLQNNVNYTLKAIMHKDYRKNLTKFYKMQTGLFSRKIRKIGQ